MDGRILKRRLRTILSETLPPKETTCVYNSYDIVGDIAIIRLADASKKYGQIIAEAIMKVRKNVKTVLAQTSPIRGDFRLRKLGVTAGENKTVTVHKESGCSFSVDVEKCYFSPRLFYERRRIAEQVGNGEVVVNMFAGVGCFSIVIAKHSNVRKIHSIDEMYYETLIQTCSEQLSISNAVGEWLDKHGIECGLPRRGAQHAEGYVDVVATINGANLLISKAAEFKSSLNSYLSDEDTLIEYRIEQTKGDTGESYDYFSSDYPSVENVVQILDENLNVIPTSVWEFDETYYNNIHWLDSSSGYIQENESYFVEVNGNITRRIEVTSVASGVISNAKIGEVTTSVTYPYLTVNNSIGISGGIDKEADGVFRDRLLAAKRRNFTLGKVADIARGINGVRAVKVYQDKGVDQSSVADWDNPTLGSNVKLDQYKIKYSQSFVPGNLVLSLGRISLKGQAINSPPAIRCGVRLDTAGTGVGNYRTIGTFNEENLKPGLTGFQDIEIDLKFNGLDKTKTYRIDLWLKQPENGVTGIDFSVNYWNLRTSTEQYGAADTRYDLFQVSGGVFVSMGSSVDLMFKSSYNGAGYTCILSPEDGFGFNNLKTELDGLLDYVDGQGYSPIGIQYQILESDEINIDIKGVIYVDVLADFAQVRNDIITNIENYLESLETGEDVIYAMVEYQIMKHPQVINQKELYIKRYDESTWEQKDISIADTEIADLGTRNLQRGVG